MREALLFQAFWGLTIILGMVAGLTRQPPPVPAPAAELVAASVEPEPTRVEAQARLEKAVGEFVRSKARK